ncbi:hypothetical protein AwPolaro_06260 [Polaromonas sp.]|nr:hypothetical protein AwPolaro_06260 [Polaromonas sp.]
MLFKKTLLAVAALAFAGAASAVTPVVGSFQVTLKIESKCTIATLADVGLGTRQAGVGSGVANTAKGSTDISVTCNDGLPYSIGLVAASNPTNITGGGWLLGASTTLPEKIPYVMRTGIDGGGLNWGSGANVIGETGSGVAKIKTVFVSLASLSFKPDSYSDTVNVTVTY